MKTALLIFSILSIAAQVPHAFYVIKIGSSLSEKPWFVDKKSDKKKWMKLIHSRNIQATVFSLIIANAIMFTVLLGMHYVAVFWMLVEWVINGTYVKHSLEAKFLRRTRTEDDEEKITEKVERFAAHLIAYLTPFCILAFTWMYVEYDWIIEFFNTKAE